MSKVRPLSPYMNNRGGGSSGGDSPKQPASGLHLLKYSINKKDPSELLKSTPPVVVAPQQSSNPFPIIGEGGKDSPRLDVDEQSICNEIPISKFKSNHLSNKRREMLIKVNAEEEFKDDDFNQLSPSAT